MVEVAEQHEVEWTPDRIRRFWDFHSNNPALTDMYFSSLMGRSLLAHVARRIRIGTAVDIGCGHGHLLDLLMRRGSDVYGADQSPSSVDEVNARLGGAPKFKGAQVGTSNLRDEIADTVFMVEVVEHLDDQALDQALDQARRLLKPGGHLVLTTPNDENLDALKIMCPDCGAVFHQVQHVRSWSASTLAARVAKNGFTCRSSEGTALTPYGGWIDRLYRTLYLIRHKGDRPHLIYIGTKR